ncbi:MAG: FAD-dependent oxidoreductase [Myxococcales bacterium]|nr:FAD-dependent oxidoreductase [Myxococcales bacterium]
MSDSFDVVVVGAGAAGTWAATLLARAGRRVALLERRPLNQAGASWVNGVAPWMMNQAQVPPPQSPEDRGLADAFVMAALHRPGRIDMRPAPVRHVDMRHLTGRLHGLAVDAGVTIVDETRALTLHLTDGRPTQLETRSSAGDRTFSAALFVDAAGMKGVLRAQVPALAQWCPPVGKEDICNAAQQVRKVADPAGARDWLASHSVAAGETVSFVSVVGGFSTVAVHIDPTFEEMEVLTGSVQTGGVPTGSGLLKQFVADHAWVGERVFGGAGAIPIRRSWDRLSVPGLALVGDAACQVFPGHGSGVGPGLIAARHLAHAVRGYDDPGCLDATWRYQSAYQRDVGAVCASYAVFRRLTQGLSANDSAAILAAGLLSESMATAGLRQRMVLPKLSELPKTLAGLAKEPRLAVRLGPAAARMQAVHAIYRRYPLTPHEPALRQWSARVRLLFGDRRALWGALS